MYGGARCCWRLVYFTASNSLLGGSPNLTAQIISDEEKKSTNACFLWVGCVAGALADGEYRSQVSAAGFEQIDIEPTPIYRAEHARDFLAAAGSMWTRLRPRMANS
jgi:hypothetical protein